MEQEPTGGHAEWIAEYGESFWSEDPEEHEAARRRTHTALQRAFADDDWAWIAHCLHELGALDLERFGQGARAVLRFAAAVSMWNQAGEPELAQQAVQAFALATQHVEMTPDLWTWSEVIERDRLAIDTLELTPSSAVVDLGCGEGRSTVGLADRVPEGRVIAIDVDGDALARCGQLTAGLPPEVVRRHGDVLWLPVPEEPLDAAYAAAVLEHVPDPTAALTRLARWVRPGGHVGGYVQGRRLQNVHEALEARGLAVERDDVLSEDRLRAACEAAGLEAIGIETRVFAEPAPNRDVLVRRLAAHYSGPPDEAEEAAAELAAIADVDHLDHEWTFFRATVPAAEPAGWSPPDHPSSVP